MAYIRKFIETCEAYGWNGGPEFRTRIVPMANGRERRNADWAQARHKFILPFQNIDAAGYRDVRQMFEVCRGQAHCFLYSDPLDREADDELIGSGDGDADTFQLSKLSVVDGVTYHRNVYALPDAGTWEVTIDGTPTTAYTFDKDRGLVVFDSPPADGALIRWSGPFVIWVRFMSDWLPFSIDNRFGSNGDFAHNGQIELLECVPPDPEPVP